MTKHLRTLPPVLVIVVFLFSVLTAPPVVAVAVTATSPNTMNSLPIRVAGQDSSEGQGWVSVRSYGATADGLTDDTKAIRAAFAATMSNGTPPNGGRTIVFDRGVYKVTGAIPVGSNQHIVFRPGTVINAITLTETTSLFAVSGQSNVTFEGNGAVFNGNRLHSRERVEGNSAAVFVYGSRNVSITNLVINDFATDGITISGDDSTRGTSQNVLVEHVVCNNNRRNGLSIISARGVRVIGGEFSNSNGSPAGPWAGIDIEPNSNSFLDDVTLVGVNTRDNLGAGIQLTPGALSALPGKRFHVNIEGGRSYHDAATSGSGALFFVNGALQRNKVYGQASVRGFLVDEPLGSGIRVKGWDADKSPRILLDSVSVFNPDSHSKLAASNLDRAGFALYAEASQASTNIGNIILRDCTAEDTRAAPRMTWGCVVGADATKKVRNVRIENLKTLNAMSVNNTNVFTQISATSILEEVDVVYATPEPVLHTTSGDVSTKAGQRIEATSGATLTLPRAASCKGIHYDITTGAGTGATVLAFPSDVIQLTTGPGQPQMNLGTFGAVWLRSQGATNRWTVESLTAQWPGPR